MWTCKSCGLLVMFSAVEPQMDVEGIFFLCPGCGHRNPLENVDPSGEGIALGQPQD